MIISRLLKQRFTSILITLLITLQISACNSTGDNLTAATTDINSDLSTGTGTGTNQISPTADINLSWAAPAAREDNSAISLSEIAGYHVFYGTTQGQYSSRITINDGTAAGYTFIDFHSGTYYFVVTTLDTEGRESQFSSEVVITI